MFLKLWNGYQVGTSAEELGKADHIYYIAENESVYHTSAQCTHIQLSIRMVQKDSLNTYKNVNQEKYHACEKCENSGHSEWVYITASGNKYHTDLSCSGIKRTVHEVSDVGTLKPCSRCGGY